MKVLYFNSPPYLLAHGGMKTWTDAVMREVSQLGVKVEPARWWDAEQKGDVVHFFLRPPIESVRGAHAKGVKIVMTQCLDVTASRPRPQLFAQRCLTELARRFLPESMTQRLGWDAYQDLDAMVYVAQHEWEMAKYLFRANPDRGHIVPHGLEPEAIARLAQPQEEADYLVCMATIYERKNSLLLAQAARLAQVPVVFLGKPFSEADPYFQEFKKQVDGKIVRHAGHVVGEEKNRWLRGARGFVLLSRGESGCIAIYEAAAAGLPLLLSKLPWATQEYGRVPSARFVPLVSAKVIASDLRRFYEQAHRQAHPSFPILTWRQIAQKYKDIYEKILAS